MAQTRCLVIIGAALLAIALAEDFCSMKSCTRGIHTMCQFSTRGPGKACEGKLKNNKLTEKEIKEILDTHNVLRATVASGKERQGSPGPQPAGIIPSLEWDDGLAEVAQRWANQCNFEHDKCRNTANFEAGQNIAIEMASNGYDNASLGRMVRRWYDEVKFFNRRDIQKYKFEPQTGHYTQLIWGTTTHVGCGVAQWYNNKWYNTLLVCNYVPSGNYIGQQVYKTL